MPRRKKTEEVAGQRTLTGEEIPEKEIEVEIETIESENIVKSEIEKKKTRRTTRTSKKSARGNSLSKDVVTETVGAHDNMSYDAVASLGISSKTIEEMEIFDFITMKQQRGISADNNAVEVYDIYQPIVADIVDEETGEVIKRVFDPIPTEELPEDPEAEDKVKRDHRTLKSLLNATSNDIFITNLTNSVQEDLKTLSGKELKTLFSFYRTYQLARIRLLNQLGAILATSHIQSKTLAYLANNMIAMEGRIAKIMSLWAENHPVCKWAMSINGIGGIMASTFVGYLNLDKCKCAAQFWKYAGLSPDSKRVKGEKFNWSADLKMACYLLGDLIVKRGKPRPEKYREKIQKWNEEHPDNPKRITREDWQQVCEDWQSDSNLYCRLYWSRKEYETKLNEERAYADQAKALLAERRYTNPDDIAVLKSGKLKASHINMRARRYAVKMFLAHLFEFSWEAKYGWAPTPYAVAHLDHREVIPIPNKDKFMPEARKRAREIWGISDAPKEDIAGVDESSNAAK